jgi:hypothetical protein
VTVHLLHDFESSSQPAVHNGRVATVDDAMAKAARLGLYEISQGQPTAPGTGTTDAMREATEELDEIVARAMRQRREAPWRVNPVPENARRCVSYQARKSLSSRETTSPASCIDVSVFSTSSLTFGLVDLKPNTRDTIRGNSSRRRPICSLMK